MSATALYDWLDEHAEALDQGSLDPAWVLPKLAEADLFKIGVSPELGGVGGSPWQAVEAVAKVASHSLTAAFVFWGQRSFIEFLVHSDNRALAQRWLQPLLAGEIAGASGLSNAMKHLSGLEQLGLTASKTLDGFELNGRLPWVTNLRKQGFLVAAAVEYPQHPAFIVALEGDAQGLQRSDDLQLLGMQASNTAAAQLNAVQINSQAIIAHDAAAFLGKVRPLFLSLQCAMALGLARRSLAEIKSHLKGNRTVLCAEVEACALRLTKLEQSLADGLALQRFVALPQSLFELRIGLAELTAELLQLELQASGGKAYLQPQGAGFARRWRESAFIPVITPSLVQLRTELQRFAERCA